jgi:hypothetical protein
MQIRLLRKHLDPHLANLLLTYIAFYLGTGVFMPFFPVWLSGRGLSAAEIGYVVSTPFILRSLATRARPCSLALQR